MRSATVRIGLALVGLILVAAVVQRARGCCAERTWETRLGELRALAAPGTARRAARDTTAKEAWARFVEIEERIGTSAPQPLGKDYRPFEADALTPELVSTRRGELVPMRDALSDWLALVADERFQRHLNEGVSLAVKSPKLILMRDWAHALTWLAYFETLEPQAGAAPAETLASMLDLGATADDGTILGRATANVVVHQALQAARELLRATSIDPVELREALDPKLARTNARARETIENELAYMIELVTEQALDAEATGGGGTQWFELQPADDEGVRYFDGVEEALDLAELSPPEFFAAMRKRPDRTAPAIEASFMRTMRSALSSVESARSVRDLARVALAIEAFRSREGRLPDDLDELARLFPDGVPIDPASEEAFAYSVAGANATLGPAAFAELDGRDLERRVLIQRLLAWDF
jgi:hypothetical protein